MVCPLLFRVNRGLSPIVLCPLLFYSLAQAILAGFHNMVNFTCIGFDIRRWPTNGQLTADANEWEVADEAFDQVKTKLTTYENTYNYL